MLLQSESFSLFLKALVPPPPPRCPLRPKSAGGALAPRAPVTKRTTEELKSTHPGVPVAPGSPLLQ